jgi:hypothetical protein
VAAVTDRALPLQMNEPGTGGIFSEVDACELLLRYKTSTTGCCKVLHHPVWGSSVYPASLITTCPADVLEPLLR